MTPGSTQNVYLDPDHTTYIVHGASGNEELFSTAEDARIPRPEWLVKRVGDSFGVGILKATKTQLEWEFLAGKTSDKLDQVVIRKKSEQAVQEETKEQPKVSGESEVRPNVQPVPCPT